MASSPGRILGTSYALILGALVFASIGLRWPNRPRVLTEYSLHATSQSTPLYVGSAPGRRVEFTIDFFVATLYNFFKPLANDDETQPIDDVSQYPADVSVENRVLTYRTGEAQVPFTSASANVLSARALGHQFGQVVFCHGYVFIGENIPRTCVRNNVFVHVECPGGLETCHFESTIQTRSGMYTRQPITFSVSNEQSIIPHSFAESDYVTLLNDTVFKNGPVTLDTHNVISGGDQFVLALRSLGSTIIIRDNDFVTVHASIVDDINSEAIAYTVLLILVFGYWVQTSQPILSRDVRSILNDTTTPSITDSRTTRFIIGNTSFSLLMGSLISALNLSAYSHQYSPIETDVVLGGYGAGENAFIPSCSLAVNISVFVLIATLLWPPAPLQGPAQFALRSAFEVQVLLNLVLTVPPPAGQAFRLAFGAFCGTLLSFVLGRDGCALSIAASQTPTIVLVLFTVTFLLAFIVICADLIMPLVWSLRMASVTESPVVSAAWAINTCATGALFCILKNAPPLRDIVDHSSTKLRDLKVSTKFL